jgi:hypothetical protein
MENGKVTVSAKVPRKLKEELEKRGVKMSVAIRRGLERELGELKIKELGLQLLKVDLYKISEDEVVHAVSETPKES